ncbi:MAG: deoxyribodipyrimidine photolyase [Tardiphaga sp.]|jgi:deoxyribodipyrimidine photo-lyase|nr:deoxyribodipyrimidine photolyase [Tardiphaga sp.]
MSEATCGAQDPDVASLIRATDLNPRRIGVDDDDAGADAAPYFRVFNPILQGEKFDPDGAYAGRWVPELAGLPPRLIHQPWTATPLELAGPGVTYPPPIVDHKVGRERALAAYAKVRNG